jgi:hypothetical protein
MQRDCGYRIRDGLNVAEEISRRSSVSVCTALYRRSSRARAQARKLHFVHNISRRLPDAEFPDLRLQFDPVAFAVGVYVFCAVIKGM